MEFDLIERSATDCYRPQLSRKQILDLLEKRIDAECESRRIDSYSDYEDGATYFALWHAYDLIEEILKEANVD